MIKVYNFILWTTLYIQLLLLLLLCDVVNGRIVDSVKNSKRKLMTTDKESSLEDRLYDAMTPAIAQISEKNGFHTFISVGNGSWLPYNQMVRGMKNGKLVNSLHGHSTTSDERIERVVVKTVEQNWETVKDVLNTSMDTSKELLRRDTTPSHNPPPNANHHYHHHSSHIFTKADNNNVDPIRRKRMNEQKDPTVTRHRSDTISPSSDAVQTWVTVLLSTLVGFLVLVVIFVVWKHRSSFQVTAKVVVVKPHHPDSSMTIVNGNFEGPQKISQ